VNLTSPSWARRGQGVWLRGHHGRQALRRGSRAAGLVQAQAAGTTTVIEMMVTQELGDPFRRDALSKPVRYLDKYKAYV